MEDYILKLWKRASAEEKELILIFMEALAEKKEAGT